MHSDTTAHLEAYDNQHEFERMCADILNRLGYKEVVLRAPRGGSDGGMDVTFTTTSGEKGLACVTLRKDVEAKFKEDFEQRKNGDFEVYIFFCTAYLTSNQKLKFEKYCVNELGARLTPYDIEGLRSLLDTFLKDVRAKYLNISEDLEPAPEKSSSPEVVDPLSDMEFKGYAYFKKSTGEGPFCPACLPGSGKSVRLLDKGDYHWNCPLCKQIYCSDRDAYDRLVETARREYEGSFNPYSVI